ncbi:hypothetical protein SMC26_00385 [Actinomadura fulvescens]|uniref:ABM domain-containing protein n=1 Tax=Actinomadura fulvescens TaxID=46160 RepID=A0ABN3PS86_9ACTN
MSRTVVIRYTTKPDHADENQRLVTEVFDQLARENPDGLRYASFRLADGVSFVHIAEMDDDADPLPELAAFQDFQKGFKDRLEGKPDRSEATIIGSYRFV